MPRRTGHVDGTYHWCPSCEQRKHHTLWLSGGVICNPCKIDPPVIEPKSLDRAYDTEKDPDYMEHPVVVAASSDEGFDEQAVIKQLTS